VLAVAEMSEAVSIRSVGADTRGASFVEYMLLIGLVAIIAIPVFRSFGVGANNTVRAQGALVDGLLPLMGF
jgi:Flp pilus assembly pilin Flp